MGKFWDAKFLFDLMNLEYHWLNISKDKHISPEVIFF